MDISSEEIKIIIGKLLDADSSKKFSSTVDICMFLWEIVDKIMEGVNSETMTMQQKEDLAVSIASSVINFLEERGMITVELASKARSLVKTADVFLDLLLGLKGMNSLTQMVKNPTKENCFKSIFSILSCFSAKSGSVPTPVTSTPKVEELKEDIKEEKSLEVIPEEVSVKSEFEEVITEEQSVKSEFKEVIPEEPKIEEPKIEETNNIQEIVEHIEQVVNQVQKSVEKVQEITESLEDDYTKSLQSMVVTPTHTPEPEQDDKEKIILEVKEFLDERNDEKWSSEEDKSK
jgi:ribosomal protein S25